MSDDLDRLLTDAIAQTAPASGTPPASPPTKRLKYSHQAMIDLMIARPAISNRELAFTFGVTESWCSTVKSSDAFRAALAARTDEIIDPVLRATAREHFEGIAMQSLELLKERLHQGASDNLVLRAFELTSRAAGFGARGVDMPPVNPVEVHLHLEQLAEKLPVLLRRQKDAIEHQQTTSKEPT